MPVEAIHISAYLDSLAASRATPELRRGPLRELGRLGSLVIDLPYFDRFPLGVLRYLLKQPTAQSAWGDRLHKGTPALGALAMLRSARSLARRGQTQQAQRVLALLLGFVSHLAVDRSLHPLVNRMARERARRLGRDVLHHHTEVEKFHSVLFHEERNGFDFMGRAALRAHIAVQADAVCNDPALRAAYVAALTSVCGEAPSQALLARWARGYRQYVWLVSGPAGKRIVPNAQKREVRGELYRGGWGSFVDAYGVAVARSRDALDATLAAFVSADGEAELLRALPEGPIDLD
jgi:hypothetical protein